MEPQQFHEASYYTVLSHNGKKLRCDLCPHHCILTDGKSGICLARKNIGGKLYALTYLRPVSIAVDPIEKKPLFHFYPGSTIYSLGPSGCTFKCSFCQNCDISQHLITGREHTIESIVDETAESGSIGIAYTYSEPYTWFESIMDIAPRIKSRGLKNVMVTNGFMEDKPLEQLLEYVDAMNIDIKSMNPEFYHRLCKGSLDPVLQTCIRAKKKCHLEITTLLIPGENDTEEEIHRLTEFIAQNLGKDTPLHFSRYFPRYKLQVPPTSFDSLAMAKKIAESQLHYVYIGNVPGQSESETYCHNCKAILIRRDGYSVTSDSNLAISRESGIASCVRCKTRIPIVLS